MEPPVKNMERLPLVRIKNCSQVGAVGINVQFRFRCMVQNQIMGLHCIAAGGKRDRKPALIDIDQFVRLVGLLFQVAALRLIGKPAVEDFPHMKRRRHRLICVRSSEVYVFKRQLWRDKMPLQRRGQRDQIKIGICPDL